jgi:RNA polymerase sigma-B factor
MRLVYKYAYKYSLGSTEALEDLQGAGMLGLTKAAQKFDSAKGFKFSSIAVPWIRGEILHYIRGRGGNPRVPRTWQDAYMKGYGLPDSEAATKVGIPLEEWQEIKQACSCWVGEWDESYERSWEPTVLEEPMEELEQARTMLSKWLGELSEADRQLIESTYFEGKGLTAQGRAKKVRSQLQNILQTFVFS